MSVVEQESFVPAEGCGVCADPEDGVSLYPMYGVAPHDCFWRKGPSFTIGQSTLVQIEPDHCFVPELEAGEDWSHFVYPSACGVYYCPACQHDSYQAAWDALVARVGPPPAMIAKAVEEGGDG